MSSAGQSPNLIEQLEAEFQNCLAVLNNQEHFNNTLTNDTKVGTEQCIQKLLEKGRETEAFFIQRRLLLSTHRPELIVKEDIQELKAELARKEELIQRYHAKLQHWPALLQTDVPQQQSNINPQQHALPAGSQSLPMAITDPTLSNLPQTNPYTHGKGPLSHLEQSMSSIGMPERR